MAGAPSCGKMSTFIRWMAMIDARATEMTATRIVIGRRMAVNTNHMNCLLRPFLFRGFSGPTPNMRPSTVALLRLQRQEPNLVQHLGLAGELGGAGRKFIRTEHMGQDISVLLATQAARIVLRHRHTHAFEQVAKRQAVPI